MKRFNRDIDEQESIYNPRRHGCCQRIVLRRYNSVSTSRQRPRRLAQSIRSSRVYHRHSFGANLVRNLVSAMADWTDWRYLPHCEHSGDAREAGRTHHHNHHDNVLSVLHMLALHCSTGASPAVLPLAADTSAHPHAISVMCSGNYGCSLAVAYLVVTKIPNEWRL